MNPQSGAQFSQRGNVDELAPGMIAFTNPKNKFRIIELHYTADPAKRTQAWRSVESQGVRAGDWAREYELSWVMRTGRPVYNNLFDRSRHMFGPTTLRGDVELPTDGRLVIGYDTGPTATRMGASFNLFQPSGIRWTIDETYTERSGLDVFLDMVCAQWELWRTLSAWPAVHVVDPVAFEQKSQIEVRACIDTMRLYGIEPVLGERSWVKRRQYVEAELETQRGPLPNYNVHERCVMHIDGFEGSYHLPARSVSQGGGYGTVPVKNAYSEIHDSLQYAFSVDYSGLFAPRVVSLDAARRARSYAVGGGFGSART